MTQPPIAHGGFTIERQYDARPARVFAAWSNIETKAKWFIGPEGWTQVRREQNFETGGSEILEGRFANGMETKYAARFYEIIENERIVYVYDMHIRGKHHSLSLSMVEIAASGGGTRLTYTEHAAWLDGTMQPKAPRPVSMASAGIWIISLACYAVAGDATSVGYRSPLKA